MDIHTDRVIAVRTSKTVYRDGEHILKVFDSSYSKSEVLSEALNQAWVEETGLRIPAILEVSRYKGKWAIISEHIKGKTLQQLMDGAPDKKDEYLNMFVSIQTEIHAKTAPLLNKLRDKMNRRIGQSDFDATTRYELHMRLDSMPREKRICHGDFNPTNIIITDEGTAYILDWSHATQGSPAADAALTYLLFKLSADAEGADRYLELFCEKSNIGKEYVQKWIPIVAASQSSRGKPAEREFMRRQVDIK